MEDHYTKALKSIESKQKENNATLQDYNNFNDVIQPHGGQTFLKEKKDGNLAPKTYGDYIQEFNQHFYTDP